MASGSNDSQLPSVNIESADHTTLIVEPESSGPLSSLFIGNVAETVNVTGAVDSVMVARSGTPSTVVRKRAASVSPSRGRSSPPLQPPVSSGRSKRTLPVESPPAVVSPPKGSMADSGPAVESTTPLMTSVRGHWSHPKPDFARMEASNEILSLSKRIEQLEALVQGLATSQVPELEDAMRKIISSFDTLNTQSQEVQLGATQMQERQHALARDQVEMRTKLDELSSTVASSVQPPGLGTFQIHTPPGQPCEQAFPTTGPPEPSTAPKVHFAQAFPGTGPPEPPMAFGVYEQAEVPRAETMPAFMMPPPSAPIPKMPPRQPAFVFTPPTTYAQANLHFGQTSPNAGFQNPMSRGEPYDGNPSEHGVGRSIHRDVTYAIPVKAPECYKFDGNIVNFLPWKIRMLNHMATATQRYRSLIDRCIKSTTPITMANLKSTAVDKFNAWEIATEVEAFTIRFLGDKLYEDRLVLCGNEELNGLELWRNLGIKYSGEGKQAVMATGLQTFMKFAKCEDERDLLGHATDWEKYLNTYGIHLKGDEATLRSLFLGILPKAMEDKLTQKIVKYPTWRELMQYIKEKHEIKRQVMIADAIHKNKGSVGTSRKQTVNGLTEPNGDQEPAPSAPASAR